MASGPTGPPSGPASRGAADREVREAGALPKIADGTAVNGLV